MLRVKLNEQGSKAFNRLVVRDYFDVVSNGLKSNLLSDLKRDLGAEGMIVKWNRFRYAGDAPRVSSVELADGTVVSLDDNGKVVGLTNGFGFISDTVANDSVLMEIRGIL